MYTFAAQIAQNRFNEHEFRIYIAPFPAYLLAILSMAISEWRESAGHCRCAIRLIAEGVEEVSDGILSCGLAGELRRGVSCRSVLCFQVRAHPLDRVK